MIKNIQCDDKSVVHREMQEWSLISKTKLTTKTEKISGKKFSALSVLLPSKALIGI
jgi:hypothetical protein